MWLDEEQSREFLPHRHHTITDSYFQRRCSEPEHQNDELLASSSRRFSGRLHEKRTKHKPSTPIPFSQPPPNTTTDRNVPDGLRHVYSSRKKVEIPWKKLDHKIYQNDDSEMVQLAVFQIREIHCQEGWPEICMWGRYAVSLTMTSGNAHETDVHRAISWQ